jgi:hypothetical protein
MSKTPSRLRSQAEQVYHLTNQFQLQMRELESSRVPVDVQINSPGLAGPDREPDIEALGFIVMMQAAQSAREDLKGIMEQVKAINAAKAKLRSLFDRTQADRPVAHGTLDFESVFYLMGTLYGKQLDAEAHELLGDLDSLNEASSEKQMRLQNCMDQYSKALSMLSTLQKKMSDTSSQIVQNMK